MGSGGVAIAALPTVICLKVPFSDGLGGGTMTILTFHFLFFKLLTLLLVGVGMFPQETLSEWPVPNGHGYNYLWWLYTLVGVLGPIACRELTKRITIKTIHR